MANKFLVRECLSSDLNSVGKIAKDAFLDYSESDYKKMSEDKNYKFFVATFNSLIVGYVVFLRIDTKCEIIKIATKKDFRGCGIGTLLLESVANYAKNNQHEGLLLEVNEKNLSAINLYKKYGFTQIYIRKKYYNNTDDAIIMSLEF